MLADRKLFRELSLHRILKYRTQNKAASVRVYKVPPINYDADALNLDITYFK